MSKPTGDDLDTAVIIVSWNVRDLLIDCLRSVFQAFNREQIQGAVWVVDNASTDGSVELLQALFPNVHLILNEENVGFSAANNQGIRAAAKFAPQTYFLLNPDTVLHGGALSTLLKALQSLPIAGMVGPRLIYGNGRFQHSAFRFPGLMQLLFDLFPMPARLYESRWNGRYPQPQFRPDHDPFPVDFTLGAAMLIRADVVEATEGFDETFHMYCEEIDWCWRIRQAGWEIYAVPAAEIVHFGGESSKQIPAQSIINLWRSRRLLYGRIQPAWRLALAQWLVKIGLSRRANQADDPRLKAAYQQAVSIWQQSA